MRQGQNGIADFLRPQIKQIDIHRALPPAHRRHPPETGLDILADAQKRHGIETAATRDAEIIEIGLLNPTPWRCTIEA